MAIGSNPPPSSSTFAINKKPQAQFLWLILTAIIGREGRKIREGMLKSRSDSRGSQDGLTWTVRIRNGTAYGLLNTCISFSDHVIKDTSERRVF